MRQHAQVAAAQRATAPDKSSLTPFLNPDTLLPMPVPEVRPVLSPLSHTNGSTSLAAHPHSCRVHIIFYLVLASSSAVEACSLLTRSRRSPPRLRPPGTIFLLTSGEIKIGSWAAKVWHVGKPRQLRGTPMGVAHRLVSETEQAALGARQSYYGKLVSTKCIRKNN
jgi:hypothetical protein